MNMKLNNMPEEYCILVNYPELLERATVLGFNNVVLMDEDLSEEGYQALKNSEKYIVVAFYVKDTDDNRELQNGLRDREIDYRCWDIITDWDSDSKDDFSTLDDSVRLFPTKEEVERRLIGDGHIHDTDYTNRCGNCSSEMRPTDKYCVRCGAKRGEGKFKPFRNPIYVLYGSTLATKYTCCKCGKTWVTDTTFNRSARFCPECGGKRIREIESKDFFVLDVENWLKYMDMEEEE